MTSDLVRSVYESVATLTQRVDYLERERLQGVRSSRRWRATSLCMTLVAMAAFFVSAAAPAPDATFGTLTVRRVNMVDDKGEIVGSMLTTGERAVFWLGSPEGKKSGHVHLAASAAEGSVTISGGEGHNIGLLASLEHQYITMYKHLANTVRITGLADGGSISLSKTTDGKRYTQTWAAP